MQYALDVILLIGAILNLAVAMLNLTTTARAYCWHTHTAPRPNMDEQNN